MRPAAIVLGLGVFLGMSEPARIDVARAIVQCPSQLDPMVLDSAEIAPVSLGTNAFPVYPQILLDAGIGDTLAVRFVIGTDGAIEQSSYCVERPSRYDALGDAEIRAWRFDPARRNGSPVRVLYRLEVVYSPNDTLRGPMDGARQLSEVDQPGLRHREPRLTIGPMRRTFGLPRLSPAVQLEERVERAIVTRLIALAGVDSIPVVCLRVAPEAFHVWDRSIGTADPGTRARCAVMQPSHVAEVWLQLDSPRAGWFGPELIRVPAQVKTFDDTYCPPDSFLCGRGEIHRFDCEGVIRADRIDLQCRLEKRSSYFV